MTKTLAVKMAGGGGAPVVPSFEGGVVFNEDGLDCDTRVEGDTDVNLLFMDASKASIGLGVNPPTSFLHLKAGTATAGQAPLKIPSGVVLATPEAGAVEYDGKVFYSTPVARGVSPSVQFAIVPAGGFALQLTNVAQNCFPANGDVLTVEADTTYFFNGLISLSRVSVTTFVFSIGFLIGGGGSVTSSLYVGGWGSGAVNTPNSGEGTAFRSDLVNRTSSSNSGTDSTRISFSGILRINAGGTLTPQIRCSNAPDTSATVLADSFIRLYPIGTKTVALVGNIA
jgi:hypothetical protein